jgi:flagellar basal body-associated protein FliL
VYNGKGAKLMSKNAIIVLVVIAVIVVIAAVGVGVHHMMTGQM